MDINSVCRLSVDLETGGDNPLDRPILEIGICEIGENTEGFEVMLTPDPMSFDREALKAIRRPIEEFIERGVSLTLGINQMLDWVDRVACGRTIQIKGLNIAYDWMFLMHGVTKVRAVHSLPYRVEEIGSYGMGVFRESLGSKGDTWIVGKLLEKAPFLVERYDLLKQEGVRHTGLDDARRQARLILALEEYSRDISSL